MPKSKVRKKAGRPTSRPSLVSYGPLHPRAEIEDDWWSTLLLFALMPMSGPGAVIFEPNGADFLHFDDMWWFCLDAQYVARMVHSESEIDSLHFLYFGKNVHKRRPKRIPQVAQNQGIDLRSNEPVDDGDERNYRAYVPINLEIPPDILTKLGVSDDSEITPELFSELKWLGILTKHVSDDKKAQSALTLECLVAPYLDDASFVAALEYLGKAFVKTFKKVVGRERLATFVSMLYEDFGTEIFDPTLLSEKIIEILDNNTNEAELYFSAVSQQFTGRAFELFSDPIRMAYSQMRITDVKELDVSKLSKPVSATPGSALLPPDEPKTTDFNPFLGLSFNKKNIDLTKVVSNAGK